MYDQFRHLPTSVLGRETAPQHNSTCVTLPLAFPAHLCVLFSLYGCMKMRLFILTVVTFIGSSNAAIFTDDQIKDIIEFVEAVFRCYDTPGASIAVVKGNESWTLPLGYADISAKRKVTEETLFGVGSISKSFTATLISLLIDESDGKFSFDTPVSQILGKEYEFPDKNRAKRMTIKDVLSHRTGLSSLNLGVFFGGGPYGLSREDFAKLVSSLPESKPFRDEFSYSNFMYMLAGHLTEKVWGASWEDNLKSKLFDKIGMASSETMIDEAEIVGQRYARPYVYLKGELKEGNPKAVLIEQFGPAGSIASSAKDMTKFMRFALNKGKLEDGTQLIKETTFAEMWEPVIPVNRFFRPLIQKLSPPWPVSDVSMGYGLGWFLSAYRGHRTIFHPGGLHSYSALMQIFPDLDLGLYVAINGPTSTQTRMPLSNVMSILYYMEDILLGETPWLNKETACTFPKPWFDMSAMVPPAKERKPVKPEFPLVKYTGTYFNPLIGILIVSVDASTNELVINMNALNGVLVPEEDGLFGIEARGDLEFLTWPEKDNPLILYKAKFIRGTESFDQIEIMANPPLEPTLTFQSQREDEIDEIDERKTEL